MEETKVKKINLSTAICIFIIIILITALVGMYFYYNNKLEKINDKVTINSNEQVIKKSEDKQEDNFTEKCKVIYEKYTKIQDKFIGIGCLSELELIQDPYNKKFEIVTASNGFEYYKTGIKYSEFKSAMLKYVTNKYFDSIDFEPFIINENNNLLITAMGMSGLDSEVFNFKLIDCDGNEYIFEATKETVDDTNEPQMQNLYIYFVRNGDEFLIDNIEIHTNL